jgi:ABC-2 type transport system ATP-binding protein
MKQRLGIAQALLNKPKLLICDEPTSALDPVGRKDILDILLAVREQTTVIFSTHILSDVERICTDVAFLEDGRIRLCGRLSDIKTKYRREDYLLETEDEGATLDLVGSFPKAEMVGKCQIRLCDKDHPINDVLRFVADKNIAIVRLERIEPTLESLFMEVTGK